MEHIFNPDLLRAAATSALGFVSLGLMLLSAIALVFFRNSSDVIKMVMFVPVSYTHLTLPTIYSV